MVAKHQHIQRHHAKASLYRQSMMTQEFAGIANDLQNNDLPLNWKQMWDNAGKRVSTTLKKE